MDAADVEHHVDIDPTPDRDGLINWRCNCGDWGQDHDTAEAEISAELHENGEETVR
jgi:hypothetical protein